MRLVSNLTKAGSHFVSTCTLVKVARKALCHLQKEKTVVSKWVRDYSRPNCPFDPFRMCRHTPLHAKAGESLLLSTGSTGTDFSDGLPVRRRLAALCTVQVLRHE